MKRILLLIILAIAFSSCDGFYEEGYRDGYYYRPKSEIKYKLLSPYRKGYQEGVKDLGGTDTADGLSEGYEYLRPPRESVE